MTRFKDTMGFIESVTPHVDEIFIVRGVRLTFKYDTGLCQSTYLDVDLIKQLCTFFDVKDFKDLAGKHCMVNNSWDCIHKVRCFGSKFWIVINEK